MKKYKLLIIEDEVNIREELCKFLGNYGYEAIGLSNFQNVVPDTLEINPDLILLDINLPMHDGYYICRELRKTITTPIIIVTSRDTEMDEIMSMNLGADDFITKPYRTQVLLARIESLLRRTYANKSEHSLNYHGLELDISKATLTYEGKEEALTKNELKILHFLIKNQGEIVSREQIMEYLWSSELFIDDNTLSVNVTRLRKKIEGLGYKNPIETRRGLGYMLP